MIENFIPPGFIAKHALCPTPQSDDVILGFAENNLLLLKNGRLPLWQDLNPLINKEEIELYWFGEFKQQRCLLLNRVGEKLAHYEGFIFRPVRFCHETLSEPFYRIAGLARQLHYWRSTHIHCGHCGALTQDKSDERAKHCLQCNLISYPQLYPCVIVLVTRGAELLLARSPHFQPGIYSTLAGFIEPGESAEDAVYREVKEEVKIAVRHVRYALSQPWPFPNSLMLGFFAEYESGDLAIDPVEIEDAQWFNARQLPQLPSQLSISRLLIEKHLSSF